MKLSQSSGGANGATAQFRADRLMFWVRLMTSAVLAPIALGAVYIGFPAFQVVVALTAAAVLWEFTQIVEKAGPTVRTGLAIAATVVVVALASFNFLLACLTAFAIWAYLFVSDGSERRLTNSSTQAGLICAALPSVCLILVHSSGGASTVFWLLAVVWGTDIGAYAFGRLIGGPRLAPGISPNKTWSGALGGIICAVLAVVLANTLTDFEVGVLVITATVCFSVAAQLGDLAESRFKRRHGVKDSGTWVPGHGGVMDRVDGLWTTAPLAALFCAMQQGGIATW